MFRRRSAAATHNIDQAGLGEFAQQLGHVLGAFIVVAEFIRQSGVRVCADECIGEPSQFVDMRPHLTRTERAVEPNGHRICVLDRIPEPARRLSR